MRITPPYLANNALTSDVGLDNDYAGQNGSGTNEGGGGGGGERIS